MNRWLPIVVLASLSFVACSTTKPAAPVVDPTTDPSIVGAVDEAAREGVIQGTAAAQNGRRVGRVAGVLAAIFGGPECESVDSMIARYRMTRDAVEAGSAVVGAARGSIAGAKRGYELDLQFAELHEIEGVEVFRPFPDQIEAHFASSPGRERLVRIAAVFTGREARIIEIEAAGDEAFDLRDSLIDLGLPSTGLSAHRNDAMRGVAMRVGYR